MYYTRIWLALFPFFDEIFNSTESIYHNKIDAKHIYFVFTFIDFKILLLYTDMRI